MRTLCPAIAAGNTFRDCDECPEMVVIPAAALTWATASMVVLNIGRPSAVAKDMVTKEEYGGLAAESHYSADRS
jgi:hypothetical protein